MILFAIFDGNRHGDWWSLYDEYNYLLGAPRLKSLSIILGSVVMHKKPPERVPEILASNFYLDTLRWCTVTKPRPWFNKKIVVIEAEILRALHSSEGRKNASRK